MKRLYSCLVYILAGFLMDWIIFKKRGIWIILQILIQRVLANQHIQRF